MCGIVGYVGPRPAGPLIVDCLERLQYRGYDSAGIAIGSLTGIQIQRVSGPVEGLRRTLSGLEGGSVGIGHTRWATHGQPTIENAHPLASCDARVVVAHNGIIRNHQALRDGLTAAGHRFRTTTDSEVIPHLIEEHLRAGSTFERAFAALPRELEGQFAIVALGQASPALFAVRRGSPLVIGVGKGEHFVASDIPSFLPHTGHVVYLREDECVRVDAHAIHRIAATGEVTPSTEAPLPVADLRLEEMNKSGQDHFMIKEILEQASILEQLLQQDSGPTAELGQRIRTARRVFFVGAGSSYHSAIFGEGCALVLGVEKVRAVASTEFDLYAPFLSSADVVVLFSQSGETADTIAAGREAKAHGATVAAVVNSPLSTLGREGDLTVPMHCGLEIAVAATKSYTAQLALTVMALSSATGEPANGVAVVREATNALYNLTSGTARDLVSAATQDLGNSRDVFLLGRGMQFVTARESALKLKEVAGVRAEAFLLGEMKHGPLSLVDESSRVFLFYGNPDAAAARNASAELAARGARVYGVGPDPLPEAVFHIRTPDIGLGLPICQIAPIQLMSYEWARRRNLDPDRPRNLAKSVTVA